MKKPMLTNVLWRSLKLTVRNRDSVRNTNQITLPTSFRETRNVYKKRTSKNTFDIQ